MTPSSTSPLQVKNIRWGYRPQVRSCVGCFPVLYQRVTYLSQWNQVLHLWFWEDAFQDTNPYFDIPQKDFTAEDSTQDLSVLLDSGLTFSRHIESLASEVMNKLSMIPRIKHLFDKSTLLTVIYSLVFSKLFYCSTVWSETVSYAAKRSLIILTQEWHSTSFFL